MDGDEVNWADNLQDLGSVCSALDEYMAVDPLVGGDWVSPNEKEFWQFQQQRNDALVLQEGPGGGDFLEKTPWDPQPKEAWEHWMQSTSWGDDTPQVVQSETVLRAQRTVKYELRADNRWKKTVEDSIIKKVAVQKVGERYVPTKAGAFRFELCEKSKKTIATTKRRADLNFWVYLQKGPDGAEGAREAVLSEYPGAFKVDVRSGRLCNITLYKDEAVVWMEGFDCKSNTLTIATMSALVENRPVDIITGGRATLWRPMIFIVVTRTKPEHWWARKDPGGLRMQEAILDKIDRTSVFKDPVKIKA